MTQEQLEDQIATVKTKAWYYMKFFLTASSDTVRGAGYPAREHAISELFKTAVRDIERLLTEYERKNL